MTDIAIIGAGPAGLSAAVNAVARGRSVTVFGRNIDTSFLYKAEKVNNHLGMPAMSGEEMLKAFRAHADSLGVEIKDGRVLQIMPMGDYFAVNFENDIFQAKTVIIAVGITKAGKIKGEEEFLGRGVSYCATCDGMLYRGKNVAVVGEIEEAEEDVEFLSKIAGKVYYLPYFGGSKIQSDNIERIEGKAIEVSGEDFVTRLKTDKAEVEINGVFFVKGAMPFSSLIAGIETENGAIKVDRLNQTNMPGVFACGDCTGWPYQVSNAIGEGLVAAQQADKYISGNSGKK